MLRGKVPYWLCMRKWKEGFMNGENSNKNNLGHTTDAVMETLTQV